MLDGDVKRRWLPSATPLRIALLAPPWIPVPAPGYGGIEEVVRLLAEGLVERGHDVTMFAPPGSESPADVQVPLDRPHPDEIGLSLHEADHVARAWAALDEAAAAGAPFDVLHDHAGFVAVAMADRFGTAVVHTLHGPFTRDTSRFYGAHAGKATFIALSRAQRADGPPELAAAHVIPNPIRVEEWPFRADKGDHLLWIGRIEDIKGPHRAIAVARAAGLPLVLAGPVQPGQEEFFATEVEPHIDGDAVRYAGELGAEEKKEAYASARALLMPIRWAEPFGLVMSEAQACGTPVIAFPEGAAPEVVRDGRTGFIVEDEEAMAAAVGRLDEIDPAECRRWAAERFGVEAAVAAHEDAYRAAALRASVARPALRHRAAPPADAPEMPAV
jgi:glycosyltransferase involved in cell wall biosynthesis